MSMASSISNLIDNVPEGNHRVICRHRHDNKNCETFELNTMIVSAVLNT